MESSRFAIKESEWVEITTLVDNYVDLLLPSEGVIKRPPLSKGDEVPTSTFLAEHGLSLLVRTCRKGMESTILFDTGYSSIALKNNVRLLDIDLKKIDGIVISHAHMDHTGALMDVLSEVADPIPLVVHPHAFLYPRYIYHGKEKLVFPRTLNEEEISRTNAILLKNRRPTIIGEGTVMVTGYVERTTPFEKGMPNVFLEKEGKEEKDDIADDQSLIICIEGKGLVIISGCSHAGIVNTVKHAQKLTGIEEIYAIIGGFHLSGAFFEPIIDETIGEIKKMGPKVIVPMHCTGWKATKRFSDEFPSSFVLNSVGSTISLGK